jgi:hypothetical protein
VACICTSTALLDEIIIVDRYKDLKYEADTAGAFNAEDSGKLPPPLK